MFCQSTTTDLLKPKADYIHCQANQYIAGCLIHPDNIQYNGVNLSDDTMFAPLERDQTMEQSLDVRRVRKVHIAAGRDLRRFF